MVLRKYRWSRSYEAAEEDLVQQLAAKKIQADRLVAEADQTIAPHSHAQPKQLWCVEGSAQFIVNGQRIALQAGDALDLPADTIHEATAGFSGCTLYETPSSATNPPVPAAG